MESKIIVCKLIDMEEKEVSIPIITKKEHGTSGTVEIRKQYHSWKYHRNKKKLEFSNLKGTFYLGKIQTVSSDTFCKSCSFTNSWKILSM